MGWGILPIQSVSVHTQTQVIKVNLWPIIIIIIINACVNDVYRHIYHIQISQEVTVKSLTMKYVQNLLFRICDYADRG